MGPLSLWVNEGVWGLLGAGSTYLPLSWAFPGAPWKRDSRRGKGTPEEDVAPLGHREPEAKSRRLGPVTGHHLVSTPVCLLGCPGVVVNP